MKPRDPGAKRVPVVGISEWVCWHPNEDEPISEDPVRIIDDCVALHEAAGFDHLVWNCGRSTIDYRSELPGATRVCELSDRVGGRSWAWVRKVFEKCCPLRRAIRICHDKGMGIYGRLGMNRHYGHPNWGGVASRFASEHPEYHHRGKRGETDPSRMCYAIPEVQQERIDILLEVQRIGVDGLVLDFCRQVPMLGYHQAVVQPYIMSGGVDPRKINSDKPEDYKDWFQYRADILTGFMRKLRQAVRKQEKELGRGCPIIARVPDNTPWLLLAYSLDVAQWCRQDLVDAIMLDPFKLYGDDLKFYPEHYVKLAHRHGKACIGGLGFWGLFKQRPASLKPAYQLVERQYAAGLDAMSVYQTETLVRVDYLQPMLSEIGDKQAVRQRIKALEDHPGPKADWVGCDNHSHGRWTLAQL